MSAKMRKFAAPLRDVEPSREGHGLAGVGDLGRQEVLEAALDAIGDAAHQIGALGHAHPPPGPLKRPTGRGHRCVDLGGIRLVHHRHDAAVDRTHLRELPCARHELPVDEVPALGDDGGRLQFNGSRIRRYTALLGTIRPAYSSVNAADACVAPQQETPDTALPC